MNSVNKDTGMFQGDEIVLRVLCKPLVRELAKARGPLHRDIDWSGLNCYVVIGRSSNIATRSLRVVVERLCTLLARDEGHFVGRLAESSTRVLEKTQQDLLEAGAAAEMETKETMGVYGPIAGEIRYSSDRINNITPIFAAWDSADYFELASVEDESVVRIRKKLQENAFFCTELYLLELTKSCHFLMRKSGDEDEVEILSTTLPFHVIYSALSITIEESRSSVEVAFKLKE